METRLLELDLAWLEIKGPDAAKFLNSVVTNDVRKATPAGLYALLLTPKGKIVA
ncbi:MAG: folate-binding protein, partial [Deltaproteobacteria bacterium]|nr:folate-binding protein [Deltaproteobacteria bacterium]